MSSGLNNIPTADTAPQGVFVFQTFTTLGNDRDADLNLGFKTGLDFKVVRFEMGAATHLLPDKGGPVTVHGKVALPFGEELPVLALVCASRADIGIISPEDAKKLIENPDAKARPIVLATSGGYKDYFRGHLPTAQHLEFVSCAFTRSMSPAT